MKKNKRKAQEPQDGKHDITFDKYRKFHAVEHVCCFLVFLLCHLVENSQDELNSQ